jgi:hypothetical protein
MLAATLKDGLGASIDFEGHTFTLTIDPESVTPPGIDGGDAIDTTSLSNVSYRTKEPRSLMELLDGAMSVFYDPAAITTILTTINQNCAITVTFPNGDTLVFYGYMKSFEPEDMVEGEAPKASITIVATNQSSGTETAPVFSGAS